MSTYKQSPVLTETPIPNTELKRWLVDYVGNKNSSEDGAVTVEMIVQTMSEEFPEFLLVIAEENFFRGYEQALADLQEAHNHEQLNQQD